MEAQLVTLRQTHGPQHPRVREIESLLESLRGRRSAEGLPSSPLMLRSAEEYGRKLNQAEAELKQVLRWQEEDLADADSVEFQRRQLAAIREEYGAQIRLLELNLKEAELAIEAATELRDNQKKLYENGVVTQSGMIEAQRGVDAAILDVERAKTLLELYRKVGQTELPQLEPVEEQARTNGKELDNPAELIWDTMGVKLRPLPRDELPYDRYRGGMQITEIRKDSPAAEAKLRVDDIIVGIDRWETISEENVVFILSHSDLQPKQGQSSDVRLFVLRGDETLSTALRLTSPSKADD